ncbi:MAG: hypothetical protein H0U54_16525 [Acidobacteria bacterium]|nr:hypothetical protein [Acidobacteriota bacterium]
MKIRIRKIVTGMVALVTCIVGVMLAAIVSSLEAPPSKQVATIAKAQNNPTQAAVRTLPPQETNGVKDQDCQACQPDKYCRLCEYMSSIEIVRHDEESEINPRAFKNLSRHPIFVDLDLSESIENQIILLRGTIPEREFKLEQQFETSLAISDEGPHLDLVDWKHYRSEWREIKKLENNKFLTLKLTEADASRFPHVTMQEIYQEVLKEGGNRWANLVRAAKTINDYPIGISVSKISLRIKVREGERWRVLKRLEFTIPMGC